MHENCDPVHGEVSAAACDHARLIDSHVVVVIGSDGASSHLPTNGIKYVSDLLSIVVNVADVMIVLSGSRRCFPLGVQSKDSEETPIFPCG